MRGMMLATALTLGAAMPSDADDKDPRRGTETAVKVTVKRWDAQGKKFLNPAENIDAIRVDGKDVTLFKIRNKVAIGTAQPTLKSEIHEGKTVWVVTEGGEGGPSGYTTVTVEKKK